MVELEDYAWLTSDAARDWIEQAARRGEDAWERLRYLRGSLPPARAGLVCELLELRARARTKFPAAEQMFLTRRALEQASDAAIGAYKALRVPPAAERWDLCCGIGGDALALAEMGPVTAVDQDPCMTLLAAANARVLGCSQFTTRTALVESLDVPDDAYVHVDPDRRPAGRRVARHVEEYQPPLAVLHSLVHRAAGAAVKLAPAAELPAEWDAAEREWISRGGECRQQVAWLGALATHPGDRRATALGREGQVLGQFTAGPDDELADVAPVGRYLYEPDAAVLAAQLTDALACQLQLARLAPHIAYLTNDDAVEHPLLRGFAVDDVLPFDRRQLKAVLKARNIGRVEIKKRGVTLDPAKLAQQLRLEGSAQATVLITPSPRGVLAVIARRLVAR